ncbi:MAG: hypothetical protein JWQ19_2644 [Subtercola sp.]|nr:hypothetical protein [Subtercola sp.]
MWAEHVVSNTSFRRTDGDDDPSRFSLDLRLNWSRAIPMSCVAEIGLKIDDIPVVPESIIVAQGGEGLRLADWQTRDDIWWPVLEPSTVTASTESPLADGMHKIEVELRIRVPGFAPSPTGVWPTRFNRVTIEEELS